MSKVAYETLKGRYVLFRVDDIYLPRPGVVLEQLHAGDVLRGKVIDLSQSGYEGRIFVVVEVDGLRQPCVLAIESVHEA